MTDRKLADELLAALIAVEMQVDVLRRQAEANLPIGAELGRLQSLVREEVLKLRELMQQPAEKARENKLSLLSPRELEIVQCLLQGLTNREIADHLGLSQHSVKNYVFRIFDKLGVSSRVELLSLALKQNANASGAVASEIPEILFEGGLTGAEPLASLKHKAERGSPAAQLALAQSYLSRRSQPDDLVEAYTWFLIASERTSQARSLVTRMLTSKQIDDAQLKASQWLAHRGSLSWRLPSASHAIDG